MASTFFERINELSDAVGHGPIEAKVKVDQVYAKIQHQSPEFKHPRGGEAYYLRDPLFKEKQHYMEHVAGLVITENGSEIKDAMIDVAEDLSGQVEIHAPREFDDLRHSGHPTVTDGERVVYDRAPKQRRLSERELEDKRKAAYDGRHSTHGYNRRTGRYL